MKKESKKAVDRRTEVENVQRTENNNKRKYDRDEKLQEPKCLHERKFSKMRSESIMTFSSTLDAKIIQRVSSL